VVWSILWLSKGLIEYSAKGFPPTSITKLTYSTFKKKVLGSYSYKTKLIEATSLWVLLRANNKDSESFLPFP